LFGEKMADLQALVTQLEEYKDVSAFSDKELSSDKKEE